MSNETKKTALPKLRFPEFREDEVWKEKKLGELTFLISERNKADKKLPIYSISNINGFVPQSSQFEGVDSHERGYNTSLYKIVGGNTFAYNPSRINVGSVGYSGELKEVLISSLYVCFKTNDELNDKFLWHFLKSEAFNQAVNDTVEGGIRSYLFYENLSTIKIKFPSLTEQQKIAAIISSLDDLITAQSIKLTALQAHKLGLVHDLFPAEGETVPKLRFPEFQDTGEWEEKELAELTISISEKNKKGKKLPVYSISNVDGFVPQSSQFEGMDSYQRGYDTTLYKVVGKNTFAYNPARINVGSIGYSGELNEVLISSLYVCFKTRNDLTDAFFWHFLKSPEFNQAVNAAVEGGIRSYLFYDKLAKIKIRFASPSEQQKIADCLSSLDNCITAQSQKIEALKIHKKGLMQGLFPAAAEPTA